LASGVSCRLCAENFVVGVEMFGGLGSTEDFTVAGARHYVAPVVAWRLSSNSVLKFSAGFGLTDVSDRALVRVGYAYEFATRRRP
jgi:hypothetical protein